MVIVLYMVKGNGEQAFECSYIDLHPLTYRDGLRKVRDVFSRRFASLLLLVAASVVAKATLKECFHVTRAISNTWRH